MSNETTCLKCGTRGVAEKVDHGIRLPCGAYLWENGSTTESLTCLRRQLAERDKRITELECLISNIGVCVGAYAVDLQEDIREAAGDFARGQLAMSRRVTRILDDEESRQMNLYEANYLAGLDEYAKKNATLKAEIERLRCIMLVVVGEAALALGDDHELVARLRAIRVQDGEANERAISIIEALLSKIPNGLQFSGTAEFIELLMNRPGMFIPLVTKEKP